MLILYVATHFYECFTLADFTVTFFHEWHGAAKPDDYTNLNTPYFAKTT